jgi:hypothetical protein
MTPGGNKNEQVENYQQVVMLALFFGLSVL